jgi:hypothetical protein
MKSKTTWIISSAATFILVFGGSARCRVKGAEASCGGNQELPKLGSTFKEGGVIENIKVNEVKRPPTTKVIARYDKELPTSCSLPSRNLPFNQEAKRGHYSRPAFPRAAHSRTAVLSLLSTGRVTGRIVNYDRGDAYPLILRIRDGAVRRDIAVNADGSYEAEAPAGVYYLDLINPSTNTSNFFRRAPFRILPGRTTVIDIDSFIGRSYCLAKGYRAVPTDYAAPSELPSPAYDEIPIRHPSGARLKLVVEYCGKRQVAQNIHYRDITLSYDNLTVFADNGHFDRRTLQFVATGALVRSRMDGKEVVGRRVKLDFKRSQPVVAITNGAISEVLGRGTLDRGNISFNFSVNREGLIRLTYEDKYKGILMVSERGFPFDVINDATNVVKFSGSAVITGKVPEAKSINGRLPVDFTITVHNGSRRGGRKDSLIIEIPQLDGYYRKGNITSGDIEVRRGW